MLAAVPCGRGQAGERSGDRAPGRPGILSGDEAPLGLTPFTWDTMGLTVQQVAELELQAGVTEPRGSPVIMAPTQALLPLLPMQGKFMG